MLREVAHKVKVVALWIVVGWVAAVLLYGAMHEGWSNGYEY